MPYPLETARNHKVSVIIPSYNHASYIDDAIKSCLDQDYQGEIEIVVIDDASQDQSVECIKKYEVYYQRNRSFIFFYKNNNLGLNHSIELGLKLSTGNFVQILASDDILEPAKFSSQITFLQKNNFDCVYSTGYLFEESNILKKITLTDFMKYYKNGDVYKFVCTQDFGGPLVQSALFKKSVLEKVKEIRSSFKSDDWAMLIFLFKYFNVGYLDEPFFKYRQHNKNSFKKYLDTFPMRIDVISRLVPLNFQAEAYSNIFFSQASYFHKDKNYKYACKFAFISLAMFFSMPNMIRIFRLFFPIKIKKLIKKVFEVKY